MNKLIALIAFAAALALPSLAMAATQAFAAPESETFAMLLASAMLMATIARRRRKS
jgi:hypothetical protein